MSELAPESGVPEEVDAPEADQWTAPTAEEWQSTQERLQRADDFIAAVQAEKNGSQGPLADYDPDFRQELDQYIDQKLGPYSQFQEQAILTEAEQRAKDILHDISVREGEFDTATARLRADSLLPSMVARYGPGPKAAEAALSAAATAQRDYEAQLRSAAVEQYQNQLRGISSAPREPAAGAVPGAQQHVTPQGGDELSLARQYFPNAR